MARVTVYKNSVAASILSIMGFGCFVSGALIAIEGGIFPGIIMVVMGFGLSWLADSISENKKFATWKKKVEEKGYVADIQSDISFAIEIYNTNPCTKTLEYIRTLNPQAAEFIAQHTDKKK